MGIRTLLLVLFTFGDATYCCSLGQFVHVEKRGGDPPMFSRTSPAVFSVANVAVPAQSLFSFPAVMAFHEALKTE